MTGDQLSLVFHVCSACGIEAPRYRPASAKCRTCYIAAALRRAKAKGTANRTAAVLRWRASLEPAARSLLKQREAAARAQREGRVYRPRGPRGTDEERKLDRETKAKGVAMKRLVRARARTTIPAPLTPRQVYHRNMENPSYVLNQRMRTAIGKELRGSKAGRRWEALVGFTLEDLERHLKLQMPRGYSWVDLKNGRLHLDHIVPKCTFDVTQPGELESCWALSNLRLIPAKENLKKGRRRVSIL